MGDLQRRYWHPIAGIDEMRDRWTKRVRLLGEDLVLYQRSHRDARPHRRVLSAPTRVDGLRDPDRRRDSAARITAGSSTSAAPAPRCRTNRPRAPSRTKSGSPGYPVEVLGGMVFAYLGPQPAPLLPRWDGFVDDGAIRMIGKALVPCNWLQVMENSLDPVHTEWLHGHLQEFVEEQQGNHYAISRKHLKIDFAEFEYGIYKRRLLEGSTEDSDDWKIGHPVIFPDIAGRRQRRRRLVDDVCVPNARTGRRREHHALLVHGVSAARRRQASRSTCIDRVPSTTFRISTSAANRCSISSTLRTSSRGSRRAESRKRHLERLGTTDAGIIIYREMLKREIAKVQARPGSDGDDSRPRKERAISSRSSATRRTSPTASRASCGAPTRATRRSPRSSPPYSPPTTRRRSSTKYGSNP